MKKFKVGKYYIFNKNEKKIGKVKIYALIEIDGILHAVFTYYLDAIKPIRTLPVEIEGETQTIHFGEAAGYYLSAAAPVSLKQAKFKVGKQYTGTDSNNKQYSVVISAKYRDPQDNKVRVVVSNRFIEEIYTDKDDNERFSLVDDVIKAENEEGEIGF